MNLFRSSKCPKNTNIEKAMLDVINKHMKKNPKALSEVNNLIPKIEKLLECYK